MKFIFWNICEGNDATIGQALIDLVAIENPDILLLGETKVSDKFLKDNCKLDFVSGVAKTSFGLDKRLRLYASSKKIIPVGSGYGDGEIFPCGLETNSGGTAEHILIFACHFVSKSTVKDEGKRLKRIIKYREYIESIEEVYAKPPKGKTKIFKGSIIFGDFNTNPFELGFTDSLGLFALDVKYPYPKKLAKYSYFVNPTFSLLGNYCYNRVGMAAAPGTFYHVKKDIEIGNEHFWNTLDGMIFRPNLTQNYDLGEPLEIITSIMDSGGNILHELFDFKTHQIEKKYSDHLPIKFSFKL